MRRGLLLAALALVCGVGSAGIAAAQSGYTAPGTTNVRSGPGTQYTVVARVGGGAPVDVLGCSNSWCDSVIGNVRGWIATSRLQFAYAPQAPVIVVPQYQPRYDPYYEPYYDRGPSLRFEFGGRDHRDRNRGRNYRDRDRDRDFGSRNRDRDDGDGRRGGRDRGRNEENARGDGGGGGGGGGGGAAPCIAEDGISCP